MTTLHSASNDQERRVLEAYRLLSTGENENLRQSEQIIQTLLVEPGFASTLILMADKVSLPQEVRIFAMTDLKTLVTKHWRSVKGEYAIQPAEAHIIKSSLLDAISRTASERRISDLYKEIVRSITDMDYPEQWPEWKTEILKRMTSTDEFPNLFASLTCLEVLFTKHEYFTEGNGQEADSLCQMFLQPLAALAEKLLQFFNDRTSILLALAIRIFHASISCGLSSILVQNHELLTLWVSLVIKVMEIQNFNGETQEMSSNDTNFWNNKIIASKALFILETKYVHKNLVKTDHGEINQLWTTRFAKPTYQCIVNQLRYGQTHYIDDKVLSNCLRFMNFAMRTETIIPEMDQIIDQLLLEWCFTLSFFSNDKETLFWDSQHMYVQQENEILVHFTDPSEAARDLYTRWVEVPKGRNREYLKKIWNFLIGNLAQGKNLISNVVLTDHMKYGIFKILTSLKKPLSKDKELLTTLEQTCKDILFQQLAVGPDWLRFEVLEFFRAISFYEFQDERFVLAVLHEMLTALFSDRILLKTKATVTLPTWLNQKAALTQARSQLHQILEAYMQIMREFENDETFTAFQTLIGHFGSEIEPFAIEFLAFILEHVSALLIRQEDAENLSDDDEADDDTTDMTIHSQLNNLRQLIDAVTSPLVLSQIETKSLEFFNQLIASQGNEYADDLSLILASLLSKQQAISDGMWSHFPFLLYSLIGIDDNIETHQIPDQTRNILLVFKEDNDLSKLELLLPTIKNYIKYGGNHFASHIDVFGRSYQTLFEQLMVKLLAESASQQEDETSLICFLHLFYCCLENKVPWSQPLFASSLQPLAKIWSNEKIQSVNLNGIRAAIGLGLWCWTGAALQALAAQNLTDLFLTGFIALPKKIRYYEHSQYILLGLIALLDHISQQELWDATDSQLITTTLHTTIALTSTNLKLREEWDESSDEKETTSDDDDSNFGSNFHDSEPWFYPEYDDTYTTPLASLDEILLVRDSIQKWMREKPKFYEKIGSCLTQKDKETLDHNIQEVITSQTET